MLFSVVLGIGCGTEASDVTTGTTGEARSADGVPIRYEVHGTGEPAIVLVHGWTNSRGIWGRHPITLSREYQVVAVDLAGHGESGSNRTEWTMEAFGQDVGAVVDQLALERVVLVGFSMGGGVVLDASLRLGERVLGVVFVDTMHDPDRTLSQAEAEALPAALRANWGNPEFIRAFGFTPSAPDSLVEYLMSMGPSEPHEHWFEVFHGIRDWRENRLIPALERAKVPMAAINTALRLTNVEAMRRYDPSFTVDTIAGVGHAGILLRRVDDFDAKLLAIVDRFTSVRAAAQRESE